MNDVGATRLVIMRVVRGVLTAALLLLSFSYYSYLWIRRVVWIGPLANIKFIDWCDTAVCLLTSIIELESLVIYSI